MNRKLLSGYSDEGEWKNIYAWIFVVMLDEHKITVCLKRINQVSPLDWDLHITWFSFLEEKKPLWTTVQLFNFAS